MVENFKLDNELSIETRIIQLFDRAVLLFKKTGLNDLAEKWNKILKNYMNKEQLSN